MKSRPLVALSEAQIEIVRRWHAMRPTTAGGECGYPALVFTSTFCHQRAASEACEEPRQ